MNFDEFSKLGSKLPVQKVFIWTRGVTIRWAMIRYISQYITHDAIDDTKQNSYMLSMKKYWNIVEYVSCCYTKTVILLGIVNLKQINCVWSIRHALGTYFWRNVFVHKQ